MAVSLTSVVEEHVSNMLAKRSRGLRFRLTTKNDGCTGFAYVVNYADKVDADDDVFGNGRGKVIVDKRSLRQLDGTEVDFGQSNLLNSGFEFHNPNVRDECGWGEFVST